jgi:hypothetical protein
VSRAGQPGGRFDARYEAHSVSAGAKDDLEQPFGQDVDWWVYDVAHQQIDTVYDVGVPEVGGRVWKGPYRLPVISAHQMQGRTPQQNHEGFFNADRLKLVIRVDTARQVGIKHIADHPDRLLHDRVVWRGQVWQPESAQPRGIVGHDRYLIVGIDATQIRPDELLNDPSFYDRYSEEIFQFFGGAALVGASSLAIEPPAVVLPGAHLVAQAALQSAGRIQVRGAATATTATAFTAAARVVVLGQAALAATTEIVTTFGVVRHSDAIPMSTVTTLLADGRGLVRAQTATSGAATLTTDGRALVRGQAALSGTSTAQSAGLDRVAAGGALQGQTQLSVSGTVVVTQTSYGSGGYGSGPYG